MLNMLSESLFLKISSGIASKSNLRCKDLISCWYLISSSSCSGFAFGSKLVTFICKYFSNESTVIFLLCCFLTGPQPLHNSPRFPLTSIDFSTLWLGLSLSVRVMVVVCIPFLFDCYGCLCRLLVGCFLISTLVSSFGCSS